MLDLYHATRDDLIRIILDLRGTLADRDHELAALTAEHAELRQVMTQLLAQAGALQDPHTGDDAPRGTPTGMPGLKPTEPAERAVRSRKRRATRLRTGLRSGTGWRVPS